MREGSFMHAPGVFGDFYAFAEGVQCFFWGAALDQGGIVLLGGVAGMCQTQGKVSVIGEQEQATGVDVEATDGVDAQAA